MKSRGQDRRQAIKRAFKKLDAKPSKKPPPSTGRAAEYKKKFKEMRSRVDAFAKTHPRFDELAEHIKHWLGKGLGLEEAYMVADTMNAPTTPKTKNRPRAKTRSR